MKDDGLILSGWAEAQRQNIPAVLATVVKTSGSSYRRPGARLFFTPNGARIGSISGGCLEGDVLKKGWWLTDGPRAALQVYDSSADDETVWEFGLGCNGIIYILLERWDAGSHPLTIDLLAATRAGRKPGMLATLISEDKIGCNFAVFPDGTERGQLPKVIDRASINYHSEDVLFTRQSRTERIGSAEIFFEYIAPPVSLLIVGAGHDAVPVVRLAADLGWDVTVLDGHANQARPERFPQAGRVLVANASDPLHDLHIDHRTCAVIMSHSYPQDRDFLRALHPLELDYLGVLGPRIRTNRMLREIGIEASPDLHSPVGLDIGADTPEEIALAIIAEIQAAIKGYPAGMLHRKSGPIHLADPVPA